MADTYYDAVFGTGFSFTFTPDTGSAFGSAQAQVEEADPPAVVVDKAMYTPISGDNDGIEQFALGRLPVQEYSIKATYSDEEHTAAVACLAGKSKGTLVCTYGGGSLTETYAGAALTSAKPGANTATGLRTADLVFTCPMPPVIS